MSTINLHEGVLTTEHSASSYNQFVYVLDGTAYGPHDVVRTRIFGDETAREIVSSLIKCYGIDNAGAGTRYRMRRSEYPAFKQFMQDFAPMLKTEDMLGDWYAWIDESEE